jgi:hypothetical protein
LAASTHDEAAQTTRWLVPRHLTLDGERLCWTEPASARLDGVPGAGSLAMDAFDRFLRLGDAPPEEVLAFGREHGPLRICSAHNLPETHVPLRVVVEMSEEVPRCRPAGGLGRQRSEPIARWRDFARQGSALVSIASQLTRSGGRVSEYAQWAPLDELFPMSLRHAVRGATPAQQRSLVAAAVQRWLDLGDVSLRYRWEGDSPQTTFGSTSLFGAIAYRMALTLSRSEGLVHCDECGRAYLPRRTPSPGRAKRCPDPACRQRAAKRDWARRQRQGD